jgi:hypothetical protein
MKLSEGQKGIRSNIGMGRKRKEEGSYGRREVNKLTNRR